MLGAERLGDIRFHPQAPVYPWPVVIGPRGPVRFDAPPRDEMTAPAMVALVRRPTEVRGDDGAVHLRFDPIGLHVTYLSPTLAGKMVRASAAGGAIEARKMLGRAAGGCVVLGRYRTDCRLFPGEGIETVLSGMALAGAGPEDCGLAALSLDNLQGFPKRWKNGALPLFDIQPDPARPPALAFAHAGPVVGLIDADMAPLRGPINRGTGARIGELVVERRGDRPVRRPIATAERAAICAELFGKAWRAAGSRRVAAFRPPIGMDCNDAAVALQSDALEREVAG
jgi:DNA primase